jgi:F-type H+-transporting ATPase subunit epsilon
MDVRVVTPEREVFAGPATMVVARAVDGDVGVLPGHAPMLVALAIGELRIHTEGGVTKAAVDGGFLHVTSSEDATRVDVLADAGVMEADVDPAEAERLRDDARQRLEAGDERARADLARAEARLSLRGG